MFEERMGLCFMCFNVSFIITAYGTVVNTVSELKVKRKVAKVVIEYML